MANWIVTIGKDYPEHWEFAVEDGFWDLTKRKSIAAGDDVFFWQSGQGLVGWTRVTDDLRPIRDSMPKARWRDNDSGRYRTRFDLTVISDAVKAEVNWKTIRAKTGITQPLSNGQIEVKDPSSTAYLRSLFMVGENDSDEVDGQKPFAADPDKDSRDTALRAIKTRRGQPKFRKELVGAYCGVCAVTGCSAAAVLEAAHITPYRGDHTNDVRNGLLLRADIHTLFDLFLLAVEDDMTMRVAPSLTGTGYELYNYRPLRMPDDEQRRPSMEALSHHRGNCSWLTSTYTTGLRLSKKLS